LEYPLEGREVRRRMMRMRMRRERRKDEERKGYYYSYELYHLA
jgi:hypothetical protein